MNNKLTTHYRYERKYSLNWDSEPPLTEYNIELIEYKTKKETDCGAWIVEKTKPIFDHTKAKFVLNGHGKRFAYRTKKEAFESFKIRTKYSLGYAMSDVENAKAFLKLIKEMEAKDGK